MSNQKIGTKSVRKAIRIAATVGVTAIPPHLHIPSMNDHGVMRMFSPPMEEEHLVYPPSPRMSAYLTFRATGLTTTPSTICPLCGEDVLLEPFMQNDTRARMRVCHTCMTTKTSKCAKCGHDTTSVELAIMRDGTTHPICRECRLSYFSQCDECGIVCYDQLTSSVNNKTMCPHCVKAYKKKNHYCRRCSTWIPTELKMVSPRSPETFICPSCFAKEVREAAAIKKPMKECKSYSSTGGKVFFTTVPAKILYLGAEVELTNGHYPQDYDRIDRTFAEDLMEFKEIERKSDGSVSQGHELATQAMELGYHQQFFQWEMLMKLHVKHGFDGHDSPKAGLHVHGSRAFFGEKKTKAQDLKIGKLLFMLDRNDWRTNWKKFSRRDNKAVRDAGISDPWMYCAFYNIDWSTRTIVEGLEKAMSMNRTNRNYVLNFYNQHESPVKLLKTVEWRGLKSHTNHRVILAALEMMSLLCNIAASKITEDGIRALTWKQMCKKIPNTSTNLVWYLQSKKLWER